NSRMLFGLSVQGNAPKFLARVSKRGVPVNSLLLSGIITSLVVLLALYPWVEIKSDSSPFVMIFHNLDSNLVASTLNFVIL
ncbi:amino acid permease, partial [Klebsiella pneumoniae]